MLRPLEDLTHVAFICKTQKLTESKALEIRVSTKPYFFIVLSLFFVLATRMLMKLANCAIYRTAESRESRLRFPKSGTLAEAQEAHMQKWLLTVVKHC